MWCPRIGPAGVGGQIVAVGGGPVAAVNAVCQSWAQGQSRGRCSTRRRPVAAIRAGTLISLVRTLAHLARARPGASSASTARAMLRDMAAQANQAADWKNVAEVKSAAEVVGAGDWHNIIKKNKTQHPNITKHKIEISVK